ncbi:MAG: DsbA family protein [Thermodesulfobacteriota bacterium]
MKTILIILILLLAASLGISGWTLSQISGLKAELKTQNETVAALTKEVADLKKSPLRRDRQQLEQPKEVLVSIDDDPIKGDPNAPLTLVEFSDYECPFCRKFHSQVMNKIEEDYIKTGKLKYVFRDFPLGFHKKAVPAAIAANCAGDQDKYWLLNNFLFENPDKLETDQILEAVKNMDIDQTKFEACVKNNNHEEEIKKDMSEGTNYGVRGTPSVFLGKSGDGKEFTGSYIRGFRPYEYYKAEIDKLLAQ